MNYGLLLYFKVTQGWCGQRSKKGENMEGIITWCIFASWVFIRTLSIYVATLLSLTEFLFIRPYKR